MNGRKLYTDEIHLKLLELKNIPQNKFMTEVRKIMKLKSSSPIWYGFSDELLEKCDKFKNKDEYARIKGACCEGEFYDYMTNETKYRKYNFQAIHQLRSESVYQRLLIEIVDGKVSVIEGFLGY